MTTGSTTPLARARTLALLAFVLLTSCAGPRGAAPSTAPAAADSRHATTATGAPRTTATWPRDTCYAGAPIADRPLTALDKGFFALGYDESRRNPAWVAYRIGPAVDLVSYPRPSGFRADAATVSKVRDSDYDRSGFDRGHMAPRFAISSRHGQTGCDATFVMSNVCPQRHAFNDGQWGDLEEWIAGRKIGRRFVKGWADEYEDVWVTVGPVFDVRRPALRSGVAVPGAFYCIVVDEEDGTPRALAFLMPHVDTREDAIARFLTSVDAIEAQTGLDFFSALPDDLEDRLESATPTALWPLAEHPN